MCVVIAGILVCAPPAQAVDPVICGYVLSSYCPGCTPNDPGGCGCGERQGSCACIKNDGNLQTGTLTECVTDDFTYNSDLNGYKINTNPDT